MGNSASRKLRERLLLEALLRSLGLDAAPQDRESPDFAVALEDRTIGIELTELFQSGQDGSLPPQAHESSARRIVESAQKRFAAGGGPSLRVSVAFAPHASIAAVHRETAAAKLSALVQRLAAGPGEIHEWRPYERSDLDLASLFSYVHVYRQPASFRPHWLVAAAGWVSPLVPAHLQARIDEKASRLSAYRKVFPEVWLVLGVWGREPSQLFDTESPPPKGSVISPFDKTYFFDAFIGKAFLL